MPTPHKEPPSTPALPRFTFHPYVLCLCFTFENGDGLYTLFGVRAVGLKEIKNYYLNPFFFSAEKGATVPFSLLKLQSWDPSGRERAGAISF